MTSFELKNLLKHSVDLLILDVREHYELDICQFEHAMHIPMMQVPLAISQIPQDKPVVVTCHLGIRSQMTVNFLKERGFENIHDLVGGIDHWAKNCDPLMQQY